MNQRYGKTTFIEASPEAVWEALTDPERMAGWMGEPEMGLEIVTDWRIGGEIVIRGFHNGEFENRGDVVRFRPGRSLGYTHLSSVSGLPDEPENHTTIAFELIPSGEGTSLHLSVENFPTDSIYKHMAFYWNATLGVLKKMVERGR